MLFASSSSPARRPAPGPVLLLASALAGCPRAEAPSPKPAELVVRGGRIRTLDPERPVVEALAVAGGRVVELGPRAEIVRRIGPETEILDLEGATAVPGLVDAHLHLEGVGNRLHTLDLVGQELRALLDAVAEAAAARPPGTPILGRGWDQTTWSQGDCPEGTEPCLDPAGFPTRDLLDRVAPNHPVVLTRVDGHARWANGAALALGGIDTKTPDPAGGRIGRDADGRPSGLLVDNAMRLVTERLPKTSAEALKRRLLDAQRELLSVGLTAVHEMSGSPAMWTALSALEAEGRLKLRVFFYLWGQDGDLDALIDRFPTEGLGPDARLRRVGVKLMADGALGSRGAALLAPYADADHDGALLLSPEALGRRARIAAEHGLAPAVHAIGDRANRVVLDELGALRAARGGTWGRLRPRIEHAQILHPEDMPRLAALGVVASMQPTHATTDMRWAEARLGPDRLAGAYAWARLRTSGATLAAGSDAPVESPDPVAGIYAARTRTDRRGQPEGGWRPEERLSGAAALAAFTRGPAWAVGAEDELGRLSVGHRADLTVLSVDPVEAEPDALLDAEARFTVVGGEVVFRAER